MSDRCREIVYRKARFAGLRETRRCRRFAGRSGVLCWQHEKAAKCGDVKPQKHQPPK